MGNRLSKIYTKTGDDGTTGLGNGKRVAKDSARLAAMGDVDELNCTVGLLIEFLEDKQYIKLLRGIQHDLFDLGGELSIPDFKLIQNSHVEAIEQALDALNEDLPPLKNFILPGGSKAAAQCQRVRAVCRRTERSVVTLAHQESVNQEARLYLNRLSDLMFVMARKIARAGGGDEILWDSKRGQD
jgi:cob(I)alamin adenosyltransferase